MIGIIHLTKFGLRIQEKKNIPAQEKKILKMNKNIYSRVKSKLKIWKEIYENLLISKKIKIKRNQK